MRATFLFVTRWPFHITGTTQWHGHAQKNDETPRLKPVNLSPLKTFADNYTGRG
ncbi:MAG: hypothetical protein ACODAD_12305 [Planctomycetota bacterium]